MGAAVELRVAALERINALWPALHGNTDCPIELPNSLKVIDKSKLAWARFTFLSDSAPVWEVAGPGSSERHFDRLQLEILGQLGQAERAIVAIADDWASLWRPAAGGSPAIAGFTFQPTQILTIGRTSTLSFGEGPPAFKVDCLTAVERSFQP